MSELMDATTIVVFVNTTKEFLNDYLPFYNRITGGIMMEFTRVGIFDQSLEHARRNLRSLQVSELRVQLYSEAIIDPGQDLSQNFTLTELVATILEDNRQAYLQALAGDTLFFKNVVSSTIVSAQGQDVTERASKQGPPIGVIVAAVCAITLVIGALVLKKFYHPSRTTAVEVPTSVIVEEKSPKSGSCEPCAKPTLDHLSTRSTSSKYFESNREISIESTTPEMYQLPGMMTLSPRSTDTSHLDDVYFD
jgi:hypothetical protein